MKTLLLTLLIAGTALAAEVDILDQAAAHPRESQVKQPDGTWRRPKYGDHQLEAAEVFLAPRFPRPWTVPKVLAWYRESKDGKTSGHLLRVLAASRDPRAGLVLGEALHSDSRITACDGLLDYFSMSATEGGTEQLLDAAQEWFTANKERLQKEALAI